MAQFLKGNYSALMWVQAELQKSLAIALQALQTFIDNNDNTALLNCVEQLYQANGTLQMLNLNGAQMLTGEMQALCQQLREPTLANADAAKETLLRSLLLLPNYLQLLNESFPDHPLCLIESINELREIRQKAPYRPQDLFHPQTTINLPEFVRPDPHRTPPTIDIAANQLAVAYQRLLLNWLQQADDGSLRKMRGIFNYLRLASHQEKVTQLWWAAEALLEALLQRGLSIQADIKQLLGKLSSPVKIVSEQGEDALLPVFPESLLQQSLLIVARASSSGILVSNLKNTYQLSFFDQQKAIYGISDNALTDAHTALLEELQKLKTQIDTFEQSAPDAAAILADINQQLLNMADTLALLNQSAASELLHRQHQQLANLIEQAPHSTNQTLAELADSLLQLEVQLRQHGSDKPGIDSTELQQAVVQECLFELGNIKENLTIASQQGDISSELIGSTCDGLQLITGSLEMLNLSAAADLLNDTVRKLQTAPFDQELKPTAIQQLAEILSAAELYMESIQQHGHSSVQLIDNAQLILAQFGEELPTNIVNDQETYAVDPITEPPSAPQTSVERYIARAEKPKTSVDRYLAQQAASTTSQSDKPLTSVDLYLQKQAIPDEARISFLDKNDMQALVEAETETETEASELSLSDDNNNDWSPVDDSDASINFSFDNDPTPEPEDALYIDLADIPAPEESDNELSLADWENPLSVADSLSEQLQSPSEPAGFAEGIDPEIAEVFLEEADEVLTELNQLIPNWQQEHDPQILGDIRRHFHTLKGSGRMAGAMAVGDLAWSVEDLLNRVLEGLSVDTEKLTEVMLYAPPAVVDLVNRFSHGDMETSQAALQLSAQAGQLRNGLETTGLVIPESNSEPESPTTVTPDNDVDGEQPLTSVDRYLLDQAKSANESFSKPLTAVDLYLQNQLTKSTDHNTSVEYFIQTLAEADNSVDEDAELLDIFLSEARQHILTLTESGHSMHVGDCIDKSQLSAAHSLKGCANIAGVMPVALIATELDQTLRELHRQQKTLNSDELQLTQQIYQNLDQLVETISDGITDPEISLL
ncbi:MAG TPA: Hpt domain-containing protein, partial [Methylophaga sp.]|nr:Hpt domain-containing protein [Methylophaga sp.]